MRKYEIPSFLADMITPEAYERWLRRRAQAHVKRDRKRGNQLATGVAYRIAIHEAVRASNGLDAYTGEKLDWQLISRFANGDAEGRGREYKRQFALLPTVDHVGDGRGLPEFKICAWRTNDVKNDLSLVELLDVCHAILKQHGYAVRAANKPLKLNGKALLP